MHPFGGSPICPRCSKAVYAAEQVMGPGRKLYHKPCLACTTCNKRLDSYSLLEHDSQPYCKPCHVKNFGTRDLRQANLPHRAETPNASFVSEPFTPEKNNDSKSVSPLRPVGTGNWNGGRSTESRSQPERLRAAPSDNGLSESALRESDEERDTVEMELQNGSAFPILSTPPPPTSSGYSGPTNTGRPGFGGIPRTVPLTPTRVGTYGETPTAGHRNTNSVDSLRSTSPTSPTSPGGYTRFAGTSAGSQRGAFSPSRSEEIPGPLVQTATGPTGTRYGAALGGRLVVNMTGTSPKKQWGGGTPMCPRCSKSVYFAEQVKAVGKTFHKNCLRCIECSTSLDSNKLRDHDGEPFCVRCYSKLHGPQGSGYALLGKAGG